MKTNRYIVHIVAVRGLEIEAETPEAALELAEELLVPDRRWFRRHGWRMRDLEVEPYWRLAWQKEEETHG